MQMHFVILSLLNEYDNDTVLKYVEFLNVIFSLHCFPRLRHRSRAQTTHHKYSHQNWIIQFTAVFHSPAVLLSSGPIIANCAGNSLQVGSCSWSQYSAWNSEVDMHYRLVHGKQTHSFDSNPQSNCNLRRWIHYYRRGPTKLQVSWSYYIHINETHGHRHHN